MPIGDELPLTRFVHALHGCRTLDELGRAFTAGFGRLTTAPMYGFHVAEPGGTRVRHNVAAGVSDLFVTRYARDAMAGDPLRARAHASRRAVYNLDLMSPREWEESEVYRRAYSVHHMRHVVEAPLLATGRPIGSLHLAAVERDLGPTDLRLAETVADVLAHAVTEIDARARLLRERDEARAALDVAGAAVVVSDPRTTELRLNEAARRLLTDVLDADERLHCLLGRRAADGPFSRRVDVELASGEHATLHADCTPVDGRALATVLDLRRTLPRVAPAEYATLTPREAEVAGLVADGLADREIAELLFLSRHTVSQYVKRVYRKLDVESRVGLTRLLLGAPCAVRAIAG